MATIKGFEVSGTIYDNEDTQARESVATLESKNNYSTSEVDTGKKWIDGKTSIEATAEDYAYFLWGIVELYKSAKHFGAGEKQLSDWLNTAKTLAEILTSNFWDEKNGGLFMSSDEPNIFARMKTPEDMNSLPSMNALAVMALTELAFLAEDKKYSDFARKIIGCFSRYARENPLRCLSMITADLAFKPFKPVKKPESEPKPVPTDEELNREEPQESQPETQQEERKSARASRRTSRQESSSSSTSSTGRGDRASRRSARPHRTRER